jgi:uncharacterized OB-fold protein
MQISILKCGDCGSLATPPHQLCPSCHSAKIAPHMVEGTGTLLSWTVIRRPPQAFRDEGAYPVAVVALAAGVPVTVRLKLAEGAPEPKSGATVHMTATHKGAAVFEVV